MHQGLPSPTDDGLYCGNDVGSWTEDKHSLVGLYDELFSTGMKNRWDLRVYIDLYSGPGLSKVRNSNRFLWGSPMLALNVKDPFDRYVFCESDDRSILALQKRVKTQFPHADVRFVHGECDTHVEEILSHVPRGSANNRVLSFCFADPYDLSIRFSTIRAISERFVDFLILFALHMDAKRNLATYLDPKNRKIDDFLGLPDWRLRWESQAEPRDLPRFLASMYAIQMQSLGYLPLEFSRMKQVRSDIANLPLYHLALFSRHQLAFGYWDDVLKYSTRQRGFEFLGL